MVTRSDKQFEIVDKSKVYDLRFNPPTGGITAAKKGQPLSGQAVSANFLENPQAASFPFLCFVNPPGSIWMMCMVFWSCSFLDSKAYAKGMQRVCKGYYLISIF